MGFFYYIIIGAFIGLIIRKAMTAGKTNVPKEYVYACSKADIINAFVIAAGQLNYEINKVDEIGGRIRLGVGASMASFGEWVDIQLMELNPDQTKVVVSCVAKTGRENFNKNRKNIETLMDCVSHNLRKLLEESIKKGMGQSL